MNVFKCEAYGAIVVAFNRGHACKLLGKALEAKGLVLDKKDKVEKIDIEKAGVVSLDPSLDLKLKVLSVQNTEQMHDADLISMRDWQADNVPLAYFGAFADSFDFLENDEGDNEWRWSFLFNRMPTSTEEVEEAIAELFGTKRKI